MDRRTKILVGFFGAIIAYALVSNVVYPAWIEPLVTLKERIAKAREQQEKLEQQQARFDHAKHDYKRYVERVGSLDIGKVENAIRARLNERIAARRLDDANVSPSRATPDRKTGLERMVISVTATGTLESTVGFLKDLAELPQLIRLGNVSLYPASSGRQAKRADRINIRVPIEILVLPQQKSLGQRLVEADFQQPTTHVRHQSQDYSTIWKRTPFTEFEPLPPLVANAGQDLDVEKGRPAQLSAKASGGDSKYTYAWSGSNIEKLNTTTGPNVTLDASAIDRYTFTLTVTDESGNTASDEVAVNIHEPKPEPVAQAPQPPSPPPPPAGPKLWPERKNMQLAMTLLRSDSLANRQELLVHNVVTNERTYYAPGDEFDGGKLALVHPRGGIVQRQGEYFVYPIGARLDQELKADQALNYPDLQTEAQKLRDAEQAAPPVEQVPEGRPREGQPTEPQKSDSKPVDDGGSAAAVIPGGEQGSPDKVVAPAPNSQPAADAPGSNRPLEETIKPSPSSSTPTPSTPAAVPTDQPDRKNEAPVAPPPKEGNPPAAPQPNDAQAVPDSGGEKADQPTDEKAKAAEGKKAVGTKAKKKTNLWGPRPPPSERNKPRE